MPIEIREIVTEVVVRGPDEVSAGATAQAAALDSQVQLGEAQRDQIVRQAVERVLDVLRREWDR
jgi:hypothetical protein